MSVLNARQTRFENSTIPKSSYLQKRRKYCFCLRAACSLCSESLNIKTKKSSRTLGIPQTCSSVRVVGKYGKKSIDEACCENLIKEKSKMLLISSLNCAKTCEAATQKQVVPSPMSSTSSSLMTRAFCISKAWKYLGQRLK